MDSTSAEQAEKHGIPVHLAPGVDGVKRVAPSLFATAVAYAHHGWKVFPLKGKIPAIPSAHGAGSPCRGECGQHGHGYHDATTDQQTIEQWWRRFPNANIGLACRPNGLAVVDVDPRNGGRVTLREIEHRHGPLPRTLTSVTGSCGLHIVYADPGCALPGKLGAGIDVKVNGYIVAPPSLHPDTGQPYWWAGDGRFDHELQPWPDFLMPPQPVIRPHRPRVGADASGFASLTGLVRVVLEAVEGERNSLLYWAARRAAEHVGAGKFSDREAEAALLAAARAIGLPDGEAARTITGALRKPGRGR